MATTWKSCLGLMAMAVAIPALAVASPLVKKPPSVPSCTHFSLSAMANLLLGTGKFELKGKTTNANLCTYEGAGKAGHYRSLLQVEVVPGSKSLFQLAEAAGRKSAGKEHKTFVVDGPEKNAWTGAFIVTGTTTGDSLPRCSPGEQLPTFGPPRCDGEPGWTTITVVAYGPWKPTGAVLMVSAGIAAQHGDVQLLHMVELDKEILSGKIR